MVIICFYLSHPSRLAAALMLVTARSLGGGHGDRPSQVLGVVAGCGEDDPLLSGDVLVYISPTQVNSRQH